MGRSTSSVYESYEFKQLSDYSQKGSKHSFRSIVYSACITVCASSVFVCCYIYVDASTLQKQAEELHRTLQCLTNSSLKEYACPTKYTFSVARQKNQQIHSQCLEKDHVKNFVVEKISTELYHSTKQLRKLVRSAEAEQLQSLVAQSQSSSRFIVHWAAFDDAGANISAHSWSHVSKLRSDPSCYTISQGGKETYVDGAVKIPQNGIYAVNAKVTVKCARADGSKKRVFFEVRMRETFIDRDTALLHNADSGECNAEGDLLTIFLSGLMRLSKDNLIYMQIKLPENVALSDYDSLYKTNLEVYYIGLN